MGGKGMDSLRDLNCHVLPRNQRNSTKVSILFQCKTSFVYTMRQFHGNFTVMTMKGTGSWLLTLSNRKDASCDENLGWFSAYSISDCAIWSTCFLHFAIKTKSSLTLLKTIKGSSSNFMKLKHQPKSDRPSQGMKTKHFSRPYVCRRPCDHSGSPKN